MEQVQNKQQEAPRYKTNIVFVVIILGIIGLMLFAMAYALIGS